MVTGDPCFPLSLGLQLPVVGSQTWYFLGGGGEMVFKFLYYFIIIVFWTDTVK